MALSCSKKIVYIIRKKNIKTWNRKLKSHEKICKNKDFYGIAMPSEKDNILEFNQYMKSDEMPYIIYADIESLIRKIYG